jgi:hypothetical protein
MRGCWAQAKDLALVYVVAMVVSVIVLVAAVYLHVNAPQWEAPATFLSLGLGLASAVWWFRAKRKFWPAGMPSALLLAFSFGSALLHGWQAQAKAIVYVGLGAGIVVLLVLGHRLSRRVEAAMRGHGDEPGVDPLFRTNVHFRDDGERITVYPRRGPLLAHCAYQGTLLTACAAAPEVMTIDRVDVVWALRLGTALFALTLSLAFARLVMRRPTLVVGPDGIVDHGSLFVSGVGLLRWDEIVSIETDSERTLQQPLLYLRVIVAHAPAIRKRQPLWKRAMLLGMPPAQFRIWRGLLNVPAEELIRQIQRYVETHAPPGWLDDEEEDEAAPYPAQ